jgi:hypothetical protein
MNRRQIVQGLLAMTALRIAPAAAQTTPAAVNVVERFGFVGDGRTDNYDAFHRWAAHVNAARGGHYVFPKGVYYVGRHRTGPRELRGRGIVSNPEIIGCDGLTVTGYGAVIRLEGGFHRSAKPFGNGASIGAYAAVMMPFEIRRSANVRIAGFEIDGGVLRMTRDPTVAEAYSYLVALNACSNVSLEDLDLHHSQTDAVLLSDDFIVSGVLPGRACRNISLRNVRCRYNGRGGLAALQVYGLKAVDCEFSSNGFPGGKYGWHAPGFGVDIEPDRAQVGTNIDTKTGNLEFVRCNFYDNFSAILAAYVSSFQGYCRFIDCNSRNRNKAPNHIIANWPGEGVLIQGGDHDAGEGCIWLSWQGQTGGKTILRGLRIRSSHDFGLMHGFAGNLAVVENCTITGTHTRPADTHFIFFAQDPGSGRRNVFRGNTVFIPAARKDRGKAWDIEPQFHNTDMSGNTYTTDLRTPGQYFATYYANCSVRNERYKGAFPGRADTFRPAGAESHDTRLPYSAA